MSVDNGIAVLETHIGKVKIIRHVSVAYILANYKKERRQTMTDTQHPQPKTRKEGRR
jgi:hypothetical protein